MNTTFVQAETAAGPPGPWSTAGLPDDVLIEARRRLVWACFVLAAGFLFAYFVPRLIFMSGPGSTSVSDVAAGSAMLMSIGLGLLSRGSLVPTARLLVLGLVFEVVGSYAIAVAEVWEFFSPEYLTVEPIPVFNGISWVCVWIVVFPALVPAPTRMAILATVMSATSIVVMFAASYAHHAPPLPDEVLANHLIGASIAGFVSAGFGVIVSVVIRGLGRKVHEARRMGSYTLVELLGRGGMGEVWRAEHRLLARPAAVKLVRADVAGTRDPSGVQVLRRFELEAQVTASLVCPHTVNLYDFGVTDDRRFYYVMELLDGINLEELVNRFGPLPAERAIHLLGQACESLAEAHAYDLIHRDIKPANLFCCRYGLEHDFIKVLDFGVARALQRPGSVNPRVTAARALIGTPAYMAPEVILGEAEPDARVDVYALGCVGYWLLTGHLVFETSSPVKMAIEHLERQPRPISDWRDDAIPPELEQAVQACLAKQPADRPPSMAALRDLLARVPVAEPWTPARAEAWWLDNLSAERDRAAS